MVVQCHQLSVLGADSMYFETPWGVLHKGPGEAQSSLREQGEKLLMFMLWGSVLGFHLHVGSVAKSLTAPTL